MATIIFKILHQGGCTRQTATSPRQLYSLIILNDRVGRHLLNGGIAVINAIEANVSLCSFDTAHIVADFRRLKSEDVSGANLAGEDLRIVCRAQPKVRPQQVSPLFAI